MAPAGEHVQAGAEGSASRAPRAAWLLALACAAVFVWELHARVPQVDDAYISYRYASNLVEGHGLVFNPGERVEGFTNPLWTLLVALGLSLGAQAPAAGHLLGLLSGLAALGASAGLAAAALPPGRSAWAGLAPWLVLASTPFARWATSGLETPLFAAAGAAALASHAAGRLGLATACAVVATLTRPEGALLAGVLFGSHLLRRWRLGLRAWRWPGVYAAFLLALTAARLAYYGEPLPNTFYAKVGGVPVRFGALYVGAFLRDGAGWLLLPAALGAWLAPRLRPAALYSAAFALYVAAIGGDALGHARLLVPLLPCLAALAAAGVAQGLARSRVLGVVAALCVGIAFPAQVLGWPTAAAFPKRSAELARARGADHLFESQARQRAALLRHRAALLRRRGAQAPLVATGAIGAFGYHARVPVLDLLGLVDREIARSEPDPGIAALRLPGHQRWNTGYVFARRPDYILIARKDSPGKGNLPAVAGLWQHPDLERLYVWDPGIGGYRRRPAPGS